MVGAPPLTWADLRDFVRYEPLGSALAAELAGFPRGVRVGDELMASVFNEIRLLRASLAGERHPKLLDLLHDEPPKTMRLKHNPSRLPVDEMRKRIGWD